MTRQTAYQILTKYLTNPTLLKHSFAVEATMRALAPRFQGDTEEWGVTGLLHDADYERAKGHPEKHGLLLFDLEPNSIPSSIEHAIESHNFEQTHIAPQSPMDWALYCCDNLTGFITTIAQSTTNKKLSEVTLEIITTKLADNTFLKEVKRESISLCEEKLGIPLQEFIDTTLKAMQGISVQLGL